MNLGEIILNNLKTSDKITFLFSLFNFAGLLILLLTINIVYFFLWYSDQKKESWYDMNINYKKTLKLNQKVEFTNKQKNLSLLSNEDIKKN